MGCQMAGRGEVVERGRAGDGKGREQKASPQGCRVMMLDRDRQMLKGQLKLQTGSHKFESRGYRKFYDDEYMLTR